MQCLGAVYVDSVSKVKFSVVIMIVSCVGITVCCDTSIHPRANRLLTCVSSSFIDGVVK